VKSSGPKGFKSAILKMKFQTKRIMDANKGFIDPPKKKLLKDQQPSFRVKEKKIKHVIALLKKTRDQRSLHDCRKLLPIFKQPGEHVSEFMHEQNIKE
jgi:hypothetical protein